MIAARGSSDNAARYAQHVLGRLCGLPVALAVPSLHTVYDAPLRYDGAAGDRHLAVGRVARRRRGARGGARAGLRRRSRSRTTPDSPMAAAATHVIALQAGRGGRPSRRPRRTRPRSRRPRRSRPRSRGDAARTRELAAVPDALARQLDAPRRPRRGRGGGGRLAPARRDRARRELRDRVRGGAEDQGAGRRRRGARLARRLPPRPRRDARPAASRCSRSCPRRRPAPRCATCSPPRTRATPT